MSDEANKNAIVEMAVEIVSAYVAQNKLAAADLPSLISSVYGALGDLGATSPSIDAEPLKPAVPIKKSITPDHLISLEDGRKYKSLKRHLRTAYNMTPEEYRTKWGLPKDYPMVAPNYAASRSALAKTMGLGRGGVVASRARAAATTTAKPAARKPKS